MLSVTLAQTLISSLRLEEKMKGLNSSEINKVGGGYLRLSDIDVFSKFDNNLFKGGILHPTRNVPVRREKKFSSSPTLRD
jgi:hypothetical protein